MSEENNVREEESACKALGSPRSAYRYNADLNAKCHSCTKTVYPMEKIETDEKTFHKKCLTCLKCNKVLSLGNYASINGRIYCKPHFMELFKLKGNYDEGFGTVPHKKKWENKA